MENSEKLRIDILKEIKKDENNIMVKSVAEIFINILFGYFDKTDSGKAVRNKLTEQEFIKFTTGLSNSFLTSVYVSASNDKQEFYKRISAADTANKGLIVSKTITRTK